MGIYNKFPIKTTADDIKIFSSEDFYWGILGRKEMQDFVNIASKEGYIEAIKKTKFTNRKFNSYTNKYSRADFHFLLPISKDAVILDLGSGYGNITIPLAHHYKKIIAADASLELLQFSKCRALSEGVNNIDYIKVNSLEYCDLPFTEKSFDVIIVSGLLEWVGPGKLDEKPDLLQRKLLNYLNNLLKDDGFLYIAIENRLFPGWLGRDPHSKLRWTSILPRCIANIYAKYKGHKNGYRTYIYSKLGYAKMLIKSGFKDIKFYYPFTTYRSPEVICPDDDFVGKFLFIGGYARKFFTRKWFMLYRVLYMFGIYQFFVASFMIIARKKNAVGALPKTALLKMLANKYEYISIDDHLIKINNEDEEYVHFFLFNNSNKLAPYAEVKVLRKRPLNNESIITNHL